MAVDVVPLTDPELAYRLHDAVWRHELPDIPYLTHEHYLKAFDGPQPGYRDERWAALLDGEPAGVLELHLPQLDNLETAEMDLRVVPGCRRRGVGRALFEHATARVATLGRKRIFAESNDDGLAFGAAVGAVAGLVETRGRLHVDDVWPRLPAMLADARPHAAGYRTVRWIGVPPDDLIDDVARLDESFIEQAPTGELEVEAEKVDAQRIRDNEAVNVLRGRTRFHTGAVHEASGRLVAWTMLAASTATWHAWQGVTLVDPAHRGHRLGLIVKIENLRYARAHRPDLTSIDTFNAASNTHMLAINRQMDFRPVDSWTQWQVTLSGASAAR